MLRMGAQLGYHFAGMMLMAAVLFIASHDVTAMGQTVFLIPA